MYLGEVLLDETGQAAAVAALVGGSICLKPASQQSFAHVRYVHLCGPQALERSVLPVPLYRAWSLLQSQPGNVGIW